MMAFSMTLDFSIQGIFDKKQYLRGALEHIVVLFLPVDQYFDSIANFD